MKRTIVALSVALAFGVAAACSDTPPSGPNDPSPSVPIAPPASPPPAAPPASGQIVYVDGAMTLINLDGSGAVKLGAGSSPDWSPDGTRLIFSDTECETDWQTYYRCVSGGLHIMNPETREITTQPGGALGVEPAWSPTGDMIAFVRHELPDKLFVIRLDGSEVRQMVLPLIYDVIEPSWSPNGEQIAFGCGTGGTISVCVINSDGTGLVRLTSNDVYAVGPAWSPDGSTIAFQFWNHVRDMGEIALMAADGSGVTHVTDGYSPAWSRDGTKLVFSGKAGGLNITNADGSNVTRLTAGGHSPAWRP